GGILPQYARTRAMAATALLVGDIEKWSLRARDNALIGERRKVELDERALGRPERRDARVDFVGCGHPRGRAGCNRGLAEHPLAGTGDTAGEHDAPKLRAQTHGSAGQPPSRWAARAPERVRHRGLALASEESLLHCFETCRARANDERGA